MQVHTFADKELMDIVDNAHDIIEKPRSNNSLPSFVTFNKLFLISCLIYTIQNRGLCSAFMVNQQLDTHIFLEDLKKSELCDNCLKRSRNCPFYQSP